MRAPVIHGLKHSSLDGIMSIEASATINCRDIWNKACPSSSLNRRHCPLHSGVAMESWSVNMLSVPASVFISAKGPLTDTNNQE